jgi:signal transduction histidine kinase/ActR/RegA family two-component response regulator
MAKNKLGSKLYLILGLIFTLTVVTVIYIVQYQTNSIITELTLNRVKTVNHSLANYLLELEDRVTMRAEIISGNEAVVTVIKSGDHESLKRYLYNFAFGMDFSSICDVEGTVLARSNSNITGDNISGYRAVSAVLRTGVTSTSIGVLSGNNNRLAIYASAPIYDGETMISIVNCIYDLANNEYVDVFKERTGCEATIFLNDERVSTTLTDESGARIIGSKAYDFVSETVLGQQKEYVGNLELYGKTYGVCYSPLTIDGKTIGMLFTGVDIVSTLKSQRSMNFLIVMASIIGIAASVAFMVVSNILARRYALLSDRQLNQQVLMANISRCFLSDTYTDTLITNTLRMVGEFMNIPQVLLFWLEDDGLTLTCRNEWLNPEYGLSSRIGGKMPLKDPMLSIIKGFKPDSGEDACLSSNDAVFKKAMSPYRVNFKNYITTPIFSKGEICAIIDFSREDDDRNWSESDISLATLFASTLSGVFEREAMGRETAAISMDLTELRRMEDELIKAKEKAERASRAKGEFLSNMSHEMRTPMNAIIGMTTIAKNAADNERKNYALNRIEESSKHLLGIINDILDMSKIEANKFELTQVEFDVRNLLHKAVSFVRFGMEEKRHHFSMNVDDNVPFFYLGDDQRLSQVIINLLSNAVKFTPQDGEIGLNVSLVKEKDGICELCFEVFDSGIGISVEQQKRIFNMFEQAESGTTRKFGGTGLGLSISKRIVELMSGNMCVESELGKRSRFIFTVNLLRDEKESGSQPPYGEDSQNEAGAAAGNRADRFAGKKMLLAEDIDINREILISLLDGTGLIIDTAENGIEALEKYAAAPDSYDLVFMDVQMPGMDGLEATQRIRTVEKKLAAMGSPHKRIPIIAMTANVFKDDIENCIAAGMDDHIGKPLDMDTVFEKLQKYL